MKPITLDEYIEAADEWMPKYRYITSLLPNDTKVEDVLKIMETLAGVALKKRTEDKTPLGFNKKVDE